jgi:hypothetical protein
VEEVLVEVPVVEVVEEAVEAVVVLVAVVEEADNVIRNSIKKTSCSAILRDGTFFYDDFEQ